MSTGQPTAEGFIRALARSQPDLSMNDILRQAAAAGYGVRKQTGLAIIRRERNVAPPSPIKQAKATPLKYREIVNVPPTLKFRRSYNQLVRYRVKGEKYPHFIYVSSDRPLTVKEAVKQATDLLVSGRVRGKRRDSPEFKRSEISDVEYLYTETEAT